VVDLSGSYEDRDVLEDYEVIERELELHAADLASRPRVVVGNKCDVPGAAESSERLRAQADSDGRRYFEISALTGEGLDPMVRALAEEVHELRLAAATGEEAPERIWRHEVRDDRVFNVRNLGGGVFEVTGRNVERMVIMTEWNNEEALAFLQKRLVKAGVEKALEEAGAREGDEVRIAGRSFEFTPAYASDPEVVYIEEEPDEVEVAYVDDEA
jgi:GTP-binding protein